MLFEWHKGNKLLFIIAFKKVDEMLEGSEYDSTEDNLMTLGNFLSNASAVELVIFVCGCWLLWQDLSKTNALFICNN